MNEEQLKQYVKETLNTILETNYYKNYVSMQVAPIYALADGLSTFCDTILKANGLFTIEKSFEIYEYIAKTLLDNKKRA
jgi:hypothetical protein